jgi:serine O-acetyltransferase
MQATDLIVDQLLDSYACCGGINHIDGVNLPSKLAVAEMTQNLLSLLFPGFFTDRPLHQRELPQFVRQLVERLQEQLHVEVQKSLELEPVPGLHPETVVHQFFDQIIPLRTLVQTDVKAAFQGDPAAGSMEEVILAYPGVEAIAVQRLAHLFYKKQVPVLPRMMTEWAHTRTGIDLHPGATIGESFFMDHGTGIVIGETCVIGAHVKIYHGVTLGARSTSGGQALKGKKRHPTLQDHVTIYPGATILGGETVIGARSVIGGNVWLTESVLPDVTVTMEFSRLNIRSKATANLNWQI